MTNPDNTVGTNAGYNGRTTPNAFNDILAAYSGRGIVAGWACSPKSGMTVQLGGDGTTRDVAIAEDNTGNRTTINNRTATPVEITLGGAPSTGSRIDTIVAYVNNPQSGDGATDVDFPSQVGIIAVSGTASGSPSAPSEATIRSAITSDGADGASAYYVELARIAVGQGVTTIGSGVISAGAIASPSNISLGSGSVGTTALASNAVTTGKIADSAVTEAKIDWTTLPSIPFNQTSLVNSTVPTGWTTKATMDISAIPTGKTFVVINSFWWRGPTVGFISMRIGYGSSYGGYTYSSQPVTQILNSATSIAKFTKVAGQDSIVIQWSTGAQMTCEDGQIQATAIF